MEKMGIAGAMADFEKVFEDMEIKTGEIDQAMDNVYASSIDASEVANLLNEVAGGVALNAEGSMGNAVGQGAIANPNAAKVNVNVAAEKNDIDEMEARLA
jgi:division protein CdvB (Snf7/Vps24/ESCRT-III family)